MTITFPKPLPKVIISAEPDDNGFTGQEKVALQNAWRVIKRRFRRHAFEIFLTFFTANEMYLERFRGKSGKFMLYRLNRHPISVLHVFGHMIEKGLDNSRHLNLILTEVTDHHKSHSVQKEEMALLAAAIMDYILVVLADITSPTLKTALEKLVSLISINFDTLN